MLKKYLFILLLIVTSNLANAQAYPDKIILKSGDTVLCKISLINDQNIFYNHKIKNTENNDFVALEAINSYQWNSKEKADNPPVNQKLFPYDSTNRWKVGIKLMQQFNYPIFHSSLSASFHKSNHNFYIGPEFSRLIVQSLGDPIDVWKQNYFGLNLGYRYLFDSKKERTNWFLQTNFSIFQAQYQESGLGSGNTKHTKIIVENTFGVGLNFKLSKHFEIYGGIGFGSMHSFFLMMDEFNAHTFIGLVYRF